VVVLSVVAHGRPIPLLSKTLEQPCACVGASVSVALLDKTDRLLSDVETITLLADRAFPCDELLVWFVDRSRWKTLMCLRGDTEIHGTEAPLGCQVRRLRLRCGQCRQTVNLVLTNPTGLPVEQPWYLISNAEPSFDLVWSYAQRFCCKQLFCDQKSGVFQAGEQWSAGAGATGPAAVGGRDRCSGSQPAGLCPEPGRSAATGGPPLAARNKLSMHRCRDPAVGGRQYSGDYEGWQPTPNKKLETCIPNRRARRKQSRAWFTKVEWPLPPVASSAYTPSLLFT
jgi:hypothetical protein